MFCCAGVVRLLPPFKFFGTMRHFPKEKIRISFQKNVFFVSSWGNVVSESYRA